MTRASSVLLGFYYEHVIAFHTHVGQMSIHPCCCTTKLLVPRHAVKQSCDHDIVSKTLHGSIFILSGVFVLEAVKRKLRKQYYAHLNRYQYKIQSYLKLYAETGLLGCNPMLLYLGIMFH